MSLFNTMGRNAAETVGVEALKYAAANSGSAALAQASALAAGPVGMMVAATMFVGNLVTSGWVDRQWGSIAAQPEPPHEKKKRQDWLRQNPTYVQPALQQIEREDGSSSVTNYYTEEIHNAALVELAAFDAKEAADRARANRAPPAPEPPAPVAAPPPMPPAKPPGFRMNGQPPPPDPQHYDADQAPEYESASYLGPVLKRVIPYLLPTPKPATPLAVIPPPTMVLPRPAAVPVKPAPDSSIKPKLELLQELIPKPQSQPTPQTPQSCANPCEPVAKPCGCPKPPRRKPAPSIRLNITPDEICAIIRGRKGNNQP